MRILQIISRRDCDSGGSIQALQLAKGLMERGHQVHFSSKPGGSGEKRAKEMGLPFFSLSMRKETDLRSTLELRRFLKEEGIEVIHAHKGLSHSLALMAIMVMDKRPILVANRGVSFPLSFWNKWKYLMPLTSGVVAVSEQVKRVLVNCGLPSSKIEVIYGGVDLDVFKPMDREKAVSLLGLEASRKVVTMVANFRPWKGHMVLLEAARNVVKEFPGVLFVLVGKRRGSFYKQFKREMESKELSSHFLLLGYRMDVPLIMAASHLIILPSLEGEGMPGVLRESLAAERPVVASSVAGIPELMRDEGVGILVPPGDAGALSQAIIHILRGGDKGERMGKKGRQLVRAHFSLQARAKAVESYYLKLKAKEKL